MGYAVDDYLRHFVRKVARRSPLINRGYYLRILAMTRLVEDTLCHFQSAFRASTSSPAAAPPPRLQVISLGAGFDTLAARCYDAQEFRHVHWYEVDFPEVIRNKTQLMCAAPMSAFPFHATATVRDGKEVVADRYSAVGLDLRNTSTELISLLKRSSAGGDFSVEAPTVVYAECVMQYMDIDCSNEIVRWVAATFPRAVFYTYDQLHPTDSFGHTMTTSLKSKQSPLLGVNELSGGLALSQRATREGMPFVRFSNFYKMSRFLFNDAELSRHDAIESFDEMEEWCEMCEHYGILLGATNSELGASLVSSWDNDGAATPEGSEVTSPFEDYLGGDAAPQCRTADVPSSDMLLGPLSVAQWPTGRCVIEGWGFGGIETLALPSNAPQDVVFVAFGGLLSVKGQARSNTLLVHSVSQGDIPVRMVPHLSSTSRVSLPALVFHTLHSVGNNIFLVIGGRTNPTDASHIVYELQVDVTEFPTSVTCVWRELTPPLGCPAPVGRYRHTAVVLGGQAARRCVFMYGGRGSDGTTLSDAWTLEYDPSASGSVRWCEVSLEGEQSLPPLHSSASVAVDDTTLLISGGATSLHKASDCIWIVRVAGHPLPNRAIVTLSPVCVGAKRFSHAMTIVRLSSSSSTEAESMCVLVQGGSTTEPKAPDDLTNCWVCALSTIVDRNASLVSAPREYSIAPTAGSPYANIGTWTRHSFVTVSPSVIAVLGGGLTCFSFGTYSCKPQLLRLRDMSICSEELAPLLSASERSFTASGVAATTIAECVARAPIETQIQRTVPELPYSSVIFCATLHGTASPLSVDNEKKKNSTIPSGSNKPKVFRGVPMGPCLEAWQSDPASIVSAETASHLPSIAVHVSKLPQPHFDFVRKNFIFRHVSIHEMLQHCFGSSDESKSTNSEKEFWYFRSVGKNMKTDRSDFWADFPLLAQDVILPSGPDHVGWDVVRHNLHQSCLRINQANMQLWTHYDTMDNVLLQMVGVKRVVLFPPEQYGNLYMKGSSSRVTNIDVPDLARFPRFADALKHAMVVDLYPGDVLFIPANWFHHITAKTSCIGLNLFYHRYGMRKELFDAKDLYGNKDPIPCTALRETLLRDVLKQFGDLQRGEQVPADYAQLALRQLIQDLEDAADDLPAAMGKLQ
jgi:tRNA wybutosine-synthesizing protein 4